MLIRTDIETVSTPAEVEAGETVTYHQATTTQPRGAIQRVLKRVHRSAGAYVLKQIQHNFESRGIERVSPIQRKEVRRPAVSTFFFWFSANLQVIMVVLGMLGPDLYQLSLLDSSLLGVFGASIGAMPVAYTATFGPRSGNRTMIVTRFVTGWYPSKIIVTLTLIVIEGYAVVDLVIGGQILAGVGSVSHVSINIGIAVIAGLTWAVAALGYTAFHFYERFAWVPQLVVLLVLTGVAGPKFDLHESQEEGLSKAAVAGNRLNFFGLCVASQMTYSQAGADFFVYYPVETSRCKIFLATLSSLTVSSAFTLFLGAGLTSGIKSDVQWKHAYQDSQGALIVEAFKPLGTYGSICSVITALSLISNMLPGIYAAGIDFQAMGEWFSKVPRIVWTTGAVIAATICAYAGQHRLAEIFTNLLSLVGYWVSSWIALFLEEHLLFRRYLGLDWRWETWEDPAKLPRGVAALVSFLTGYAMAIICMAQVWFVGPVARLISDQGGDVRPLNPRYVNKG